MQGKKKMLFLALAAGLFSSAAFEVIVGTIFFGMFNDGKIDPIVIAQSGQFAENVYFGKPCGLMAQMVCSVGSMVYIDFENDCYLTPSQNRSKKLLSSQTIT